MNRSLCCSFRCWQVAGRKLHNIQQISRQYLAYELVRYNSNKATEFHDVKLTDLSSFAQTGQFLVKPSGKYYCFASCEVEARVVSIIRQKQEKQDSVLLVNDLYSPRMIGHFINEGFWPVVCTYKEAGIASEAQEMIRNISKANISVEKFWLFHSHHQHSFLEADIVQKLGADKDTGFTIVSMFMGRNADWFNMVQRLVNTSGCYVITDAQWFGVFPAEFYWRILVRRAYKAGVILNAFYNMEHCLTIKANELCPVYKAVPKKSRLGFEGSGFANDDVVLVKLTPRAEVLDQLASYTDRNMFKSFIKLMWRNDRLIPIIEELVPDVGMYLIELGYGMMDNVKSLSADQLLDVFLRITGSQEFQGSVLAAQLQEPLYQGVSAESSPD